ATPTLSFNGSGLTLAGAGVAAIAASPNGAVEVSNAVTVLATGALSQSGNVVTVATTAAGFAVGQQGTIAGLLPLAYNATFTIPSVNPGVSFTYLDTVTGLAASSQAGTATLANTVTITTTAAHGFQVGQYATITGVTNAGYNGTFLITSVPTAN